MFFRPFASLRYRHWLAISISLFALGLFQLVGAVRHAGSGHVSKPGAALAASALVALVVSLRTLRILPDAPRIRVRELEPGTLGRSLFPQRRRIARRAEEEWQPTVWSPDEITPWSPERDAE